MLDSVVQFAILDYQSGYYRAEEADQVDQAVRVEVAVLVVLAVNLDLVENSGRIENLDRFEILGQIGCFGLHFADSTVQFAILDYQTDFDQVEEADQVDLAVRVEVAVLAALVVLAVNLDRAGYPGLVENSDQIDCLDLFDPVVYLDHLASLVHFGFLVIPDLRYVVAVQVDFGDRQPESAVLFDVLVAVVDSKFALIVALVVSTALFEDPILPVHFDHFDGCFALANIRSGRLFVQIENSGLSIVQFEVFGCLLVQIGNLG